VAVASKKKPKAEPAGRKNAKAVKAAKKTVSSQKTAGKRTPNKKSSKKKTASKKAASKKTVSEKTAAPAGEGSSVDTFEVARRTMKGSVSAIVEAMVEQAKRGSCSHAKTLLEMTGAKHMFDDAGETEDRGEPWAKLVLERMKEAELESVKTDLADGTAE
jgi:ribosomal protein L14E/L6E/L27E